MLGDSSKPQPALHGLNRLTEPFQASRQQTGHLREGADLECKQASFCSAKAWEAPLDELPTDEALGSGYLLFELPPNS